ncbi:MAG: RluA family pseudouridine synthase, partial [Oscillospiraceae bacterium]|nr:RluA family pseudouridine synthase [Oscillospiraceae bacterium]
MSGGVIPRVFEFIAERECTVEQLLKENGFSKGLIIELKKTEDGIVINGGRVRSTTVMQAGTRLVVTMPMPQVKRAKTELTVPIIYEDEDIILYDKPSGLACHRSGSHIDDTMENMMEGVFRPVTRLDRDTSGLLLAAKHQLAAGRLWQKTEKRYIARAEGHFERIPGFIELPIMRIRPYDMRRIVDECGEPALT